MAETPTVVKIWLVGGVPIWVAARIHTLKSFEFGHYLESHWPLWAALWGWTALVFIVDALVGKLKPHPPRPPKSS
jgi:hypothetical protein